MGSAKLFYNRNRAFDTVNKFLFTSPQLFSISLALDEGLLPTTQTLSRTCDWPTTPGLLEQLVEAGVIKPLSKNTSKFEWTQEFRMAWDYRDLFIATISMVMTLVASANLSPTDPNFGTYEEPAIQDVLAIFDYSRALRTSDDEVSFTRTWVDYVTTLSRYDTSILSENLALNSSPARLLEIGGNSGESAIQLVKRYPQLSIDILDLPAVCNIGSRRIANEDESIQERVTFLAGDAFRCKLPSKSYDYILFKNMLHDWPDEQTRGLIHKMLPSLKVGGCIVIFERFASNDTQLGFSSLPIKLFREYYRPQEWYADLLYELGAKHITKHVAALDFPVCLTQASF